MKKITKFILSMAVAGTFTISSAAFAGCSDKGKTDPSNPTPPPPIEQPVDPKPTPDPTPVIPTEAFDEFVALMGQSRNYTYVVDNKKGLATYEIDGNKVCVEDFSVDQNRFYLLNEGDATYRFVYNTDEEVFYKTRDEVQTDFDGYIFDGLRLADITGYDEGKGLYSLSIAGKDYTAKFEGESLVLDDGSVKSYIENVDSTRVSMPDKFVDKTEDGKDPDEKPGPEEPVVKDQVYIVNAQGVRVYDNKVLTQTVLEALNSKTATGDTLYSSITSNVGNTVDEVLFVSTTGDNLKIGSISTSIAGKKTVDIFEIPKSKVEKLSADKQDWIDALLANNIYTNEVISRSYAKVVNDESFDEEHQKVLQETYKEVMNKFAECGEQTNRYDILGEAMPRFEGASAVGMVFEANDDADGLAGFGLGETRRKQFLALTIDKNGEYVFVDINVASTSFRNNIYDTILGGGVNDKFIVYRTNDLLDVEVAKGDKALNNENDKINQSPKQYALPQGKGKE